MQESLALLLLATASIAVVHTLLGPDHYLPFVLMGRAGGWTRRKTLGVTLACGIGHVLGSVLLGSVGIAFGIGLGRLEALESSRGSLAAWALVAFGLVYAAWGLRRALRDRPHQHLHAHADGTVHSHRHTHHGAHLHVHQHVHSARSLTPWVLFVIFLLGPCEPLIPLLMVPAATGDPAGVALVAAVFGAATLLTMAGAVGVCVAGVERLPLHRVERYAHALAGAALVGCGLAMQYLGV